VKLNKQLLVSISILIWKGKNRKRRGSWVDDRVTTENCTN